MGWKTLDDMDLHGKRVLVRVDINVPGMDSNVAGSVTSASRGAQELYKAAVKADGAADYAIVTWIGYNSPGKVEVMATDRAEAGGVELASFIDGIYATRKDNPVSLFTVSAHSYGSTTAAEALRLTTNRVDTFVTYGSAGLKSGTEASDLNVDNIFAAAAAGDNIAWMGEKGGGRTNPLNIEGVTAFSAEESDGELPVTAHSMFAEEGKWGMGNWKIFDGKGEIGYLSAGTTSVNEMGSIIATGDKR